MGIWEIIFYNGTVYKCEFASDIYEAIDEALRKTGLSKIDIKMVVNKH